MYESCEEGIVKCGLSGYANAKNSSGDDVPWYKTDTFKWVVGAAVVVGTVVAAAVVLTVAAPAILTAVVVGAAIGAATGAIAGGIIGGYKSVKNGGTFAEGAADGFFWGSIGGAVSGAVAGVATATGAGLLSMSAAQGIVSAGMYTAETSYDGGQVSAAGLALSFTTGAVVSAGSVVLAGKASQLLGKLSGVLKNGSSQTVSVAESAVDGAENAVKSESVTKIQEFASNDKAYKYYMDLVDELDVSTAKDTATFYSGPGNRELAEGFAKANGKTTLEMTFGGSYLDDLKLFEEGSQLTKQQATEVWRKLSQKYAEGASGNAYGFAKGSWDGSIFNTVESPALQNNPSITNVFTKLFD